MQFGLWRERDVRMDVLGVRSSDSRLKPRLKCAQNESLARPVGEHDGKVSQTHCSVLVDVRHGVRGLPIKK